MVQQYRSPVRVYKHPFELVMAAYEKRFPTCKMIPIFAGSDILSDWKSEDGAQHVVERRCKLHVDAPYLVKKIVGVDFVYFIQKNALDRRARTLEIDAHNDSFSSRVVINETCRYYVHPENNSWTCFEQTASLDVKSFLGFESAIEKLAIKQYSHNISKGKEVIEYYISELIATGAASQFVPFTDSHPRTKSDATASNLDGSNTLVSAVAPASTSNSNAQTTSARTSVSRSKAASIDEAEPEPKRDKSADSNRRKSSVTRKSSAASSHNASNQVTQAGGSKSGEIGQKNSHQKAAAAQNQTATVVDENFSTSVQLSDEKQASLPAGRPKTMTNTTLESLESTIIDGVDIDKDIDYDEQNALSGNSTSQSNSASIGLDDDYILRYLGSLTPVEESRLLQLRDAMIKSCTSRLPMPSNATMLRFLRARGGNVEKARAMLCRSLKWRRRHSIDRLRTNYEPHEVLRRHFAGGWHYFDKKHNPLYILRLGAIDVKGLLKSCGEERVLRHVLAACEEAVCKLEDATKARGHAVTACTLVIDLDGLGMRHLWRPGVRALLRILEQLEANYPEMMNRVLVIRAPRVFPVLWTLVSPIIDDATRQKFVVFSGREHLGPAGLEAFVDRQYLPVDLGGDCEWCDIPEGGLVPKSAYRAEHDTFSAVSCVAAASSSDAEVNDDKGLEEKATISPSKTATSSSISEEGNSSDPVYRTAILDSSNNCFEIRYSVTQSGAVITWDFEVLDGDVDFQFSILPLSANPEKEMTTAEGNSNEKFFTHTTGKDARQSATAMSNDSGVLLSNLANDAGVDSRANVQRNRQNAFETTQKFGKGASVQGSHISTRSGDYVLRWTATKVEPKGNLQPTKLSYYSELLSRMQFHGSLTSLRSCRSSLCSLDTTASLAISYRNASLAGD